VNAYQLRRLAAIEAALALDLRPVVFKATHELTDPEAIEEVRRLVRVPYPCFSPADIERVDHAEVARLRALVREQYGP
jgi:hypothetical protein